MAVLLLVFAAFDDITTDTATTFRVEYSLLVASAVWLLFVSWRLFERRRPFLGAMSVLAVATAAWAQRAIGPGSVAGLRPEYVALTSAYLWFWALALTLLWFGWRARHGARRGMA